MTYKDINLKFTEKVLDYTVMKGYNIDTTPMGGSQGEIAKVCLTDGHEIVVVMLRRFYGESKKWWLNGVELIVGKCTDPVEPNSYSDFRTLWLDHLDIFSRDKFYELANEGGSYETSGDENRYGTEDEAEASFKENCKDED